MSYWKLKGGRYGGITARGKRFIVSSRSAAIAKMPKSKTRTTTKKGGKNVAKNAKRRQFTVPITIVLPAIAGPFIPPGPPGWATPVEQAQAGNFAEAARSAMVSYIFFDPGAPGKRSEGFKWDGGNAIKALLVGTGIHWIASKLGVNRYLGRAGVPVLRV